MLPRHGISKEEAGSLFNIIDADGLISKKRCLRISQILMFSDEYSRQYFYFSAFSYSLLRSNLAELEQLFPDLSSFAKTDPGYTIDSQYHNQHRHHRHYFDQHH